MSDDPPAMLDDDLWTGLRRLTAARIGLKRVGASLATGPRLDFKFAHARARDAVHEALDQPRLVADLSTLHAPVLEVASAAGDRQSYLMRPDLGRRLSAGAEAMLAAHAGRYDIAFVVSDGLSARAVQMHATPVLAGVLRVLRTEGWRIAPLVIVTQGRVAIGDAVAATLGADCVALLIGERPGLSAPDSMGAYLTWRPQPHTTDADRNCISNIRPDGIGYVDAASKLAHMLRAMRELRASGLRLKDDSDRPPVGATIETDAPEQAMKAAAVAAASLLAAWPAASPVSAQSVEEFYKTHPVTIMVGFNVGNIYDTVMRTVARHIGRHIPGNPTVVPVNRPGAGSLAAANQVFNASPRDGTVIGVFNRSIPTEPLLGSNSATKFDATKFTWIGNVGNEVSVCVTSRLRGRSAGAT